MQDTLPDKLYFKIGEVARYADVAPHVIRYWESEFDRIQPTRANSKQRLFKREDVLLILEIKSLLHGQGFTIAGAKKILEQKMNDIASEKIDQHTQKQHSSQSSNKLIQTIKNELLNIQQIIE